MASKTKHSKIRLFIGFYPPQDVIKKIETIKQDLMDSILGRWVNKKNLHVTLQFLGYINEENLSDIKINIEKAVKNIDAFTVYYKSISVFPNETNPRILWVGLYEKGNNLNRLKICLDKANKSYLKEKNKVFSPHLTIARLKSINSDKLSKKISFYKDEDIGKQLVNEIYLFESKLKRQGAGYEPLGKFVLGN